jgi:hypothetical protein
MGVRYSGVAGLGRRIFAVSAVLVMSAWAAHTARSQAQHSTPNTQHPTLKTLSGADVVATVEGRPITRRELTYFWISTDRQAGSAMGDLLAERWRAAKGNLPVYSVSESAIYARLYGKSDKNAAYANILSNLVTNRLVEIEAKRKHIAVTPQEARAAAHEMLDQVRKQQNLTLSDEEIMVQFNVPRDIFLEDMVFRLRVERLLAVDYARRKGHPITAEDRTNWKQIVEAQKPDYLIRLRHNAHITSVIPLPEPAAPTSAQNAGTAEMPPPPPDVKH